MSDVRDIYQSKMCQETNDLWASGVRNVLQVLPTGGGKSKNISRLSLEANNYGIEQAIIAHRTELVGQLSDHIASVGIPHQIIAPKPVVAAIAQSHRDTYGRSFVNPDALASVVAVDTLVARQEILKPWAIRQRRWTIDEAHHVLRANKWGTAVSMFPNAQGLGVTASPIRTEGFGLGSHADGVFDAMVLGPSMRELITMGALCDYEIVCPESDLVVDDADFSKDGELSPKKGRLASQKSHIVGDIVKEYTRWALGKRTIVFVTDVETAQEVATNFNNHGIAAMAVSAKTDNGVRRDAIERFKDGRLTVLINVDLFGEGFDVPAVECVIMGRPTGSLAVYLQQFGRALRLLSGKKFGLIIDMVSNFKRHGFPDKRHDWSLDRTDKKSRGKKDNPDDLDELVKCRACSRPYLKVLPACDKCGAEPIVVCGARTLKQVDGDLTLLDREALAAMRAAVMLESPASVADRVAAGPGGAAGAAHHANKQMARIASQRALGDAVAVWAGAQRAIGRSDREIDKRFYAMTEMSVPEALTLNRQEMDKLAETVKGWVK